MREHVRFDPTKGMYVSNPCRATLGRCPFDSESTKHFETREEARQYVESMNEKNKRKECSEKGVKENAPN